MKKFIDRGFISNECCKNINALVNTLCADYLDAQKSFALSISNGFDDHFFAFEISGFIWFNVVTNLYIVALSESFSLRKSCRGNRKIKQFKDPCAKISSVKQTATR